ncbi:MAG: hypothetical protein FWF30_00100 [Coriobacteriia bacterium]|nr:hypothetical protein [Coriobacteriia bacterium]
MLVLAGTLSAYLGHGLLSKQVDVLQESGLVAAEGHGVASSGTAGGFPHDTSAGIPSGVAGSTSDGVLSGTPSSASSSASPDESTAAQDASPASEAGSLPPIPLAGISSSQPGPPLYHEDKYLRSWELESSQSCPEVGELLLRGLQGNDYKLERSGYIDLGQQSWSCTATSTDGNVLLISVIPECLGRTVSESNPLVVRLVELKIPDLEAQP